MQSRLILFAASAGIAALTIYLLISGRNILIPIAIAVMAWYLINAIARGIMSASAYAAFARRAGPRSRSRRWSSSRR